MGTACQQPDLPFAADLSGPRRPHQEPLRLSDGYQTSVYVHSRPGSPDRLPVLYLHGVQSHPGWFVGSAADLADRGHAVFQAIRRGSGDTRRDRGHARSAGQLLEDVQTACQFALDRTGARRLDLLGVSWGGKLAAAYALWTGRRSDLASLTLVAPGIVPQVDVPTRTKLGVALTLLVQPRRRFDIPLNDVELFTDNELMRQYLRGDPFRLHRATSRLLWASRRLDGLLRRAPAGALTMPTTLLLASRDRIIDNDRTRRLVARLAADRLNVREFDSAHVLEFQPDRAAFYDALAAAMT